MIRRSSSLRAIVMATSLALGLASNPAFADSGSPERVEETSAEAASEPVAEAATEAGSEASSDGAAGAADAAESAGDAATAPVEQAAGEDEPTPTLPRRTKEVTPTWLDQAEEYTAIGLDVMVVRPLSFGAVAVGAPFFLAAAPFAWMGGHMGATYDVFLQVPIDYAWWRPLGDL